MLRAIKCMLRGVKREDAELALYIVLQRRGLSCYKAGVQSLRGLHV
jgi:hypothetical protein